MVLDYYYLSLMVTKVTRVLFLKYDIYHIKRYFYLIILHIESSML